MRPAQRSENGAFFGDRADTSVWSARRFSTSWERLLPRLRASDFARCEMPRSMVKVSLVFIHVFSTRRRILSSDDDCYSFSHRTNRRLDFPYGSRRTTGRGFFLLRTATFSKAARHRCHPVQCNLPLPAFMFLQALARDQDILNRRTLQDRTAGNLNLSSPIPTPRSFQFLPRYSAQTMGSAEAIGPAHAGGRRSVFPNARTPMPPIRLPSGIHPAFRVPRPCFSDWMMSLRPVRSRSRFRFGFLFSQYSVVQHLESNPRLLRWHLRDS